MELATVALCKNVQQSTAAKVVDANNSSVEMSAESKPRLKILLTGFGPFNQRLVNGSWLGVRQFIAESFECNGVRCEIVATQCTVDWGAPTEQVLPVVRAYQPDIVLSFGEAKDNFRIECLARKLVSLSRTANCACD